jgi:hypothetical protein
MSAFTYPLFGTCDMCAEGPTPLREIDPDSEAWVCRDCDALMTAGFQAAALAMDVPYEVAVKGIEAYHRAAVPSPHDTRTQP